MRELAKIGLWNIVRRKKRALLTVLGIFIGIAAVVALVSIGQGLQQSVQDQFSKVGGDKILVQAKEFGVGGVAAAGKLGVRELDVIQHVIGVGEAAGGLALSGKTRFNDVQRTVFVAMLPVKSSEANLLTTFTTWEADKGRLLRSGERGKVVIGATLSSGNVFLKDISLRNTIVVNDVGFDVVGILTRTGDPTTDSSVILSEPDARAVLNSSDVYSYIVAQAVGDPDVVSHRVERALRRDRHQKEGNEDFSVQTSTELIASFNTVLNIIQVIFVGIAAISLLVGGVGIMNTMFTAVLERTREIGVMKAIGATNSSILFVFMLESGILGLLGGVAGVLVGAGIGMLVEQVVNYAYGAGTIHAVFPVWLVIGAVLFAGVIGILSGLLPALRASRLSPVEALREE